MSLSQAARLLGAEFSGADRAFLSVSTDSRSLEEGALFVALRGERFDGHDYIDAALERGAAGVLSERVPRVDVPTIRVADSLDALQRLAAAWRRRFTCPVVAVTGSNGKTTVKEMIGRILSRVAPTLVSAGNLNNHIGVPLTLLRLREDHQFAVVEMGMNHAGELTLLSAIAAPDVALVNNAAAAHLEGLGSVEGVACAKGEIFTGLRDKGIAVINADDAFAAYWRGLNQGRTVRTFGFDGGADVVGEAEVNADHSMLTVHAGGAVFTARIHVAGLHNAKNALAAAAVAGALGAGVDDIVAGLESFRPVGGRSEAVTLTGGARLIDDTYNANPASMAAAIDMLARQPGTRVLVMGDMGELGSGAPELHRESGMAARRAGIDRLLCYGENSRLACEAFGADAQSFNSAEALAATALAIAAPGVTFLVKGSRSMRMERIADALRAAGGSRGRGC